MAESFPELDSFISISPTSWFHSSHDKMSALHPENNDLVDFMAHCLWSHGCEEHVHAPLGYESPYAPPDMATYPIHLYYSVVGKLANPEATTAGPIGSATPAQRPRILSDGSELRAVDRDRLCAIIGTKDNVGEGAEDEDDRLSLGIPQFPSVVIKPEGFPDLESWQARADFLTFPFFADPAMARMMDYRTTDDGTVQMLIHPTQVIRQLRQLLTTSMVAVGRAGGIAGVNFRFLVRNQLEQIYVCAVAIVQALAGVGEANQNDDDHERMNRNAFRQMVRRRLINLDSLHTQAIRDHISAFHLEREGQVAQGVEGEIWFVNRLIFDWITLTITTLQQLHFIVFPEAEPKTGPQLGWMYC